MTPIIAAIDQGTTSTRCVLFDPRGAVAAHQLEHRQHYPQSGWVEHDPADIWDRACDVVRGALAAAGDRARDVVAIGIANQRETTVVWDRRTGRPYANAVVWSDTRTKDLCDHLARHGGADRFRDHCGLPLATYFSAPKLRWLLDHVPAVRDGAAQGHARFGTIDAWLLWNLTGGPDGGVHATDVTNASRTMLLNLRSLDWDDTLLDAFGIPRSMLPRVVACNDPRGFGTTRASGPFGRELPICGVVGDQQAALIGQACFAPGESKNTYGTGCFLLANTGAAPVRSTHGMLTTVAYQLHGGACHYALEGSIAAAGSLVQWARDNLGLIGTASQIEALARSVPDSGGVCFVPAFSGLFAPWWRADARGTVVGLTQSSTKAHLARAILDAVAWQTKDVLDAIAQDAGCAIPLLKVDGGMSANALLMQTQADALGIPVVRSAIRETTALGAAYAAGLAVGVWPDQAALRAAWQTDATWSPQVDAATRDRGHRLWLKAIERSKGWVD